MNFTKSCTKFIKNWIWKSIYKQWMIDFQKAYLRSHFGWYKLSKTMPWLLLAVRDWKNRISLVFCRKTSFCKPLARASFMISLERASTQAHSYPLGHAWILLKSHSSGPWLNTNSIPLFVDLGSLFFNWHHDYTMTSLKRAMNLLEQVTKPSYL